MNHNVLHTAFTEVLASRPTPVGFVVAFSGGRDSVALLHCAHQIALTRGITLRALHINHQLQAAASEFAAFCQTLCDSWQIPLQTIAVTVTHNDGDSLEAAAREARYSAFKQQLRAGEWLLLGQHRDDQAETFLLQALRGAGIAGLAGMPGYIPFADGFAVRPLLTLSRADIDAYIAQQQLPFVDDPSNTDISLKRNALRQRIWPSLLTHFPGAEKTLARSAQHCAEATILLNDLAAIDAEHCVDPARNSLRVSAWRQLSAARRHNVLRWWLKQQHARLPSEARLHNVANALTTSDSYHLAFDWDGFFLRRYRDHVFVLTQLPTPLHWQRAGNTVFAPDTNTRVIMMTDAALRLTCRELPAHIHAANLDRKTFLQKLGVPEWLRQHIPAIYDGEQLLCYGNLWHNPATSIPQLIWQGDLPVLWQRCCVPSIASAD